MEGAGFLGVDSRDPEPRPSPVGGWASKFRAHMGSNFSVSLARKVCTYHG